MTLPLLLVPGLLTDAALWTDQRYAFGGERPVRVLDISSGTSIDDMAARLLRAAPDRFALAGLSMGGYVALAMAVAAPGRVAGLALLDTNAHADPPAASERRRAQIAALTTDGFDAVVEQLLGLLVTPAGRDDPHIGDVFRAMAHRLGPDVFIRQQQAIMGRADRTAALGAIAVPTLVLCGAEDAIAPPELHRDMAARLPNAELAIVERAGHLAPLEAPAQVTEAMQGWLARIEA